MSNDLILGLFCLAVFFVLYRRSPPAASDPLDRRLFAWPDGTPFLLRHLVQSVAIFGASGSGKTSGSGRHLARAMVSIPNSGGLILASKPEERAFWEETFRAAGRSQDLIVFGPHEKPRLNFLEVIGKDSNDITNALESLSETLNKGGGKGGGGDSRFWDLQRVRTTYSAVEVLRQAGEPITGANIERYVIGAANSPELLLEPAKLEEAVARQRAHAWRTGYHNDVNGRAGGRAKSSVERQDFDRCIDFWLREWPNMDQKVRSGVTADLLGVLHPMNTGIVRELISTTTDVSPSKMEEGKFILVDMPAQTGGESFRVVNAMWKYAFQRYVLARGVKEGDGVLVCWSDEYQNYLNSHDAVFLAECRSHLGCMIVLTQSLHSYLSTMGGDHGAHFVEALLTNAATKIAHTVGDSKTAEYLSGLLGQRRETFVSLSPSQDEKNGATSYKPSVNETYQPVLQPFAFMDGSVLLNGGPRNRFQVGGIVIRSEPFRSGERFLYATFSQR